MCFVLDGPLCLVAIRANYLIYMALTFMVVQCHVHMQGLHTCKGPACVDQTLHVHVGMSHAEFTSPIADHDVSSDRRVFEEESLM